MCVYLCVCVCVCGCVSVRARVSTSNSEFNISTHAMIIVYIILVIFFFVMPSLFGWLWLLATTSKYIGSREVFRSWNQQYINYNFAISISLD